MNAVPGAWPGCQEAPEYNKGCAHKMKAVRSSWGGNGGRGEMKSWLSQLPRDRAGAVLRH